MWSFTVKLIKCLFVLLLNCALVFSTNFEPENNSSNGDNSISNANDFVNITTCETHSVTRFGIISCAVTLYLKPSNFSSYCSTTKNSSILVNFNAGYKNDNATLMCTSSKPISITVDFEDGALINRYANINTGRVCKDYYNRTSCIYKVSVGMPTFKKRTYKALEYNVMVQYKMFIAGEIVAATNILWYFVSNALNSEIVNVHWFSESYIITVPDGSNQINIPCTSQSSKIKIYRIRNYGVKPQRTKLQKLDDRNMSFDIHKGFFIQISVYKEYEGNYICTLNEYDEESVYDIEWRTFRDTTVYFEIKVRKDQISRIPSSVKLEKIDGVAAELPNGSTIVNFTGLYNELERRRTAIIVPQGENGRLVKLSYIEALAKFKCATANAKASIKQMHCNSVYQCELFAKCLFFNDSLVGGLGEINRFTKCLKSIRTESGCCPNSHRYEQMNNDVVSHGEDCELGMPAYKKGIVRCSSKNEEMISQALFFKGFDEIIYTNISILPVDAVIQIVKPKIEKVYSGGKFQFTCEALSFFYEEGLMWLLKFKNGTTSQIPNEYFENIMLERETDTSEDRNPKSVILIHMEKLFLNVVEIICVAPVVNQINEWHRVSTILNVFESSVPEIIAEDTEVEFRIGISGQCLTCKAIAFPKAEITWTFENGTVIEDPFSVTDNVFSKVLQFPKYREHYAGEYKCTVTNIAGNSSKVFTVTSFIPTGEKDSANKVFLPIISGLACFLVVFYTVVILYLNRQRKLKVQKILEMEETIRILNGNVPLEKDDDLPGPYQTPYNKKFEMERTSFYVERKRLIGSGQYGEVYKGRMDIVDGDIAIKTVKVNCPTIHLKALVSEMKILMYIGAHDNIVQMLGSYTKEITKGIIFVALEFCTLGSLESHLKSHRHLFLANKAANDGYVDIKAFNSSRFNCNVKASSKELLLKWSAQIANAMVYLGLKKVVHFDLAARNVLLTAEGIAKVTDFGLSRILYNYDDYIKNGLELLPWRSLALESLTANVYSVKSDVWAYGITLYEIFSIGGVPYPGIEFGFDFVRKLEAGFRNQKPQQASTEIYDLMLKCWNPVPEDRPSFENIRLFLEEILANKATNIDKQMYAN